MTGPKECRLRLTATLALLLPLSFWAPAHALDVHGAVRDTSEYTDNSRRVHTLKEHDWIHRPELDLSILQKGRQFDVDANYQLERRVYTNNTFSDDTLFSGAGRLSAEVIPDAVRWFVQHNRTQSVVNSQLQNTPNNQQVTNTISTGPQVRWAFSARNTLNATLQYQAINANRSSNDSGRIGLDSQLQRRLNEGSSIGLRFNASKVNFQSQFGNDYERGDLRATYVVSRGVRTKLTIEAGGVLVNRDRGKTERDWTGLLGGTYQFTDQWKANLTAKRDATDQAEQALRGARQFGEQNNQRSDISEAFVLSSVDADVTRIGARSNVTLGVSVSRRSSSASRLNEKRRGAVLAVGYRIGPTLMLDAVGRLDVVDFQDLPAHDIERNGDIRLVWQIGRSLTAQAGMSINSRDSPRTVVSYTERRASIGLGYRF